PLLSRRPKPAIQPAAPKTDAKAPAPAAVPVPPASEAKPEAQPEAPALVPPAASSPAPSPISKQDEPKPETKASPAKEEKEPIASASATPPPAPPAAKRRRIPPFVSSLIGWALALGFLAGLAYGAIYYLRQTQVQGLIVADGYLFPSQVAVVRDFSGDVGTLRSEFRSARGPLESDLAEKESNLKRVESDLAVVEQRKKLYQQAADDAKAEVGALLDRARLEADALWKNEGGALDAEFAQKNAAFLQALVDRAAALKLPFAPNAEANPLKSPDVWANAFRLALYDPPPAVKATAEREWLEKQLTEWHAYEKTYDDRLADVKKRAGELRKSVSPQMDAIQARIDKANGDVAAAETDAAPLRDELATAKTEAEGARVRIAAQREAYAAQLLDIPKRNVLQSLPLDGRGRFHWEHLEANPQFPPGNYLLWAQLRKDDKPYWAVVPFQIREYRLLKLVLKPGAFVPALDLLQ
ncbi:MAG TPA: hypothetical protein VIM58_04275, partial [Candidatus Methylacidiphilales bacterium]